MQSEVVAEKLDESYSYLDVAGYNYSDARYELDGERVPNRVIVGTETHNTNIVQNWPKVLNLADVIGDFTWTGWDYLGEVGLGRVSYGEDSGLLMGDYPWLAAWCADIDITGRRRALHLSRDRVRASFRASRLRAGSGRDTASLRRIWACPASRGSRAWPPGRGPASKAIRSRSTS